MERALTGSLDSTLQDEGSFTGSLWQKRISPSKSASTSTNTALYGKGSSTTTTFLSRPLVQGFIITYCLISQPVVGTCLCSEDTWTEIMEDILQSFGYLGISMIVQIGMMVFIRATLRIYRLWRHGYYSGDDSSGMVGGGAMAFLEGILSVEAGEVSDESEKGVVSEKKNNKSFHDHDDNDNSNIPGEMYADADSLQRDTVVSVGSSKGDRRPNRVAFNGGSVNLPHKPSNAISRATRKESSGKDGIFGLQRNLRKGMKSSEWHLKNLLDGINKALKRVADSESYLISRIVRTILWCTLYLFVTRSMTRECNSEGLVEAICGPTGAEPCDWVISIPFEWQRVWFDSIERVFLWMVNVDWCICYYVARNKSEYFKSVACWTDILTMPALSLLFWFGSKAANTDFDADTYFVRYGFIRFLRLYGMEPTFEILFPNMSMTRRQVLSIALGVLSLLLMFSGAIFNEESCTMGRKDYFITYEDFVYFLIITMSTVRYALSLAAENKIAIKKRELTMMLFGKVESTGQPPQVGYGDFSPITLRGRILVLVFIALTLSLVTLQVKKLMLILAEDNIQYGVAPSSSLYYILMVCDRVDLVLIQSLIKELYTTELYEGAPPVLVITTTELPHERTCKKLNETCTALGIHLYIRRFDFVSAYNPPSLNATAGATAGENTPTTTSSSSASSASGNKNKIIVYATMLGGTNTLPIRLDLAAAVYILTPPPSSGPSVTSAVPNDSHLYSTTASSVNSGNSDGAVEDKMTYLRILALGRIFTPSTAGARDVLFREEMMGRIVAITNTKEFDAMIRSQGVAGVLCVSEFRQKLIARHCAGIKGFPTLISNLVSKFDRIPPPPQQQQISYTTKRSQGDTPAMPDPTSPVTPPVSEAGTVKATAAATVPGSMSLKEEASGFADYCRGAQYRLMVIHCPPIDNEEVDDEEVGQGEGRACSSSSASATYMIRYKRAVEHLYHSYNVLLLGLLVPPSGGEMAEGEGERKLLINPDPETIFAAPLLYYEAAEGLQDGNDDDEQRRSSNACIEEEKSYVDLLVLCDSEVTLDTLQYYTSWPPSCVTKVKKKTTRSTRSSQLSSARHSTLSGGRPDHQSKGHRSSYASHAGDDDDDDDDDGCISVTYEDELPAVFPNTDDKVHSPSRRESSARWKQHRMTAAVSEALSPRPTEGASSLSRLSSASNSLLSSIRASPWAPRRCPISCDTEDGDDFATACLSLELQRARVLQRLFKGATTTSARRKTKTHLTTAQRPSTQSIIVDEQGPATTEAMGGKSGRPAEDASMGKSAASSSSLLALPSLDSTQQQQQATKTSDEEGFLDYGLECTDVTQALGRYARYMQQPLSGDDNTTTSVPASPNITLPPRIILLLGYQTRTLPHFLHDLFKSLPRPSQPQHGSILSLAPQASSSTACSHCGRPLPLVVCLSPVSPVDAILNDPSLSTTTASFHINILNSYVPYFSYIRGSINDDVDLLRGGLNLAHTVCIFNSPPTPPLSTRQGAQQQSLPHHQHTAVPTIGMTTTNTPGTAYPPPPTRSAPINPVDSFGMFSPMKTTMATAMAGANANALQPGPFASQGLGGPNHVKSDDEVVVTLWKARSVLMMVKAGSGQKVSSSRRSSTALPLNDKTQDKAEGSREQQQREDDEEQKAVPKSPAGHRLTIFARQASMVSGRRSEFHSKRSSTAATGATLNRSRSFGRFKSSTLHGGLGKGATGGQTTGMLSSLARLFRWRTAGKRGKNLVKRISLNRPRRDSIFKASYRAALVGGPSSSSSTDIIHRFGNAANPHKAAALFNALQQSIIFTTCSTLPPAALQPPMLLDLADHRSVRLADVSRWTPDGGGVPNFRESAEYASGRIVTNAAFRSLICQLPGVSSHMLTIDIVRQFISGVSFGGGHTFNLIDCPARHWGAPFSRVFFDLYDEGTICIGVYRGSPVFDTPLQCLPFVLTCPRPNLAMTPGDQLYIIPRGAAYTIW